MPKLLFVLKKREITESETKSNKYCTSTGLLNSATFVVDMLNRNDISADIVTVVDNNDIDREIAKSQPTHVVIEAFWVVPEKFDVLKKLHPSIIWIVRNHSEIPFLAIEGIAINWTLEYINRGIVIAPNSPRAYSDTYKIVEASYGKEIADAQVWYLPNFYQIKKTGPKVKSDADTLNVGCFGAIRPLKNQLIQAIAAISFARSHNKKLRFHINVARLEDNGNVILRSIRSLFDGIDPEECVLVEHDWLKHDDFLDLVNHMDIGLQVSFTESFNIVAADFVACGVPIVVSKEISWMPQDFVCDPTSGKSIVKKMNDVLYGWHLFSKERKALKFLTRYNERSITTWLETFE